MEEFYVRAGKILADVDANRQILHTDGWSDPWKRLWVGCIVRFIDESWQTQELCTGFEHTASWTSVDAGGQHAAGPTATAIRVQWRKFGGAPLPMHDHSDSTNSAVAVGKLLGMSTLRCTATTQKHATLLL